jgi:hypothetical protein
MNIHLFRRRFTIIRPLPSHDIFGDSFRSAFFPHYQLKASSTYFDLWALGKGPADYAMLAGLRETFQREQ